MAKSAIEMCMGHALPMGGAYSQLSEDEIWEEFKKAEQDLTIEASVAVNGLGKIVEGLRAELEAQTASRMEELAAITDYEKLIREQGERISELQTKIKALEEKLKT